MLPVVEMCVCVCVCKTKCGSGREGEKEWVRKRGILALKPKPYVH